MSGSKFILGTPVSGRSFIGPKGFLCLRYTDQEEIELNKLLKKWQKRQLVAIKKNNIDTVFESMNEIDRRVWEVIANANSYKDINHIAWGMAEKVIGKYCKLAR